MGRQNTIVFGSQIGTSSTPPAPRTGTLVHESSVRRNDASASATRAPLPPVTAPPRARYGSDPGPSSQAPLSARAPASSRFESQWFAPTNPKLSPVGPEIFEERRGWTPPPPSRGLAFAAVSLVLVGVAAAGSFFFLGPDGKHSASASPVSTTTITNADLPTTPAPAPPPTPESTSIPTVTPADLPSAPPVVDAVKEPGVTPSDAPKESAKKTAAMPAAAAVRSAKTTPAKTTPAKTTSAKPQSAASPSTTTKRMNDSSLPDLDRAAAAAGMTPRDDDAFATPGNDTPPAPSTTPTGGDQAPSTQPSGEQPAPSEVMPGLEIKR